MSSRSRVTVIGGGIGGLAVARAALACGLVLGAGAGTAGGCGSANKSAPVRGTGDGGGAASRDGDGGVADAAPLTPQGALSPYLVAPLDGEGNVVGSGSLQVTVQWRSAPVALRRSAGRNECGRAKSPPLAVHTLHGVEGAVIALDGIATGVRPPAERRIEVGIEGCELTPLTLAGRRTDGVVEIVSRDERRHHLAVSKVSASIERKPSVADREELATFDLPIIGARGAVALAGAGVYRVDLADQSDRSRGDSKSNESSEGTINAAWIVVTGTPYVSVTDDVGSAMLAEVPEGSYELVVWHRPLPGERGPRRLRLPVEIAEGRKTVIIADLAAAIVDDPVAPAAGNDGPQRSGEPSE